MSGAEVVPVEPARPPAVADTAAQAAPAQPPVAPKRRRRGWIVAAIVIVVVAVLGVVAFLVVDGFAKDSARDYVRARMIAVLALPEDARVDVDLGGGSIILQALAGRVDVVDVRVPEATFGGLTGSVVVHAEGVPLDETAPVDVLDVEFAVPEAALPAIAGSLSGLTLDSIDFDGPEIVVSSAFSLFGVPVPLGMSLLPSAADGQLVFTPVTVTVAETTFDAEDVTSDPIFGPFARELLRQQTVCIADSLPQALVLTAAEVETDRLVLTFDADGAALGGPALSTMGTCGA